MDSVVWRVSLKFSAQGLYHFAVKIHIDLVQFLVSKSVKKKILSSEQHVDLFIFYEWRYNYIDVQDTRLIKLHSLFHSSKPNDSPTKYFILNIVLYTCIQNLRNANMHNNKCNPRKSVLHLYHVTALNRF